MTDDAPIPAAGVRRAVTEAVARQPVVDMHTHLYPPTFGTPLPGRGGRADPSGLMLWGIDELLTYHYLVAELFRAVRPGDPSPADFLALPKRAQADLIWRRLFVDQPPLSEACRGVLTTVAALGLDPSDPTPDRWRAWFDQQDPSEQIDRVMAAAGVSRVTMTNNPFDDNERRRWLADPSVGRDRRFDGVLRIDPLLVDAPRAKAKLAEWGYPDVRAFLGEWIDRTGAVYVAVSLPPTWRFPSDDAGELATVLDVCRERRLPLAMMIGVRRRVNPAIGDAGDGVGPSDVSSVERLCAAHPGNRFLVTTLAREDQHALAVAARKFANLMPFGCWWFLNTPGLITEVTRMRLELLGPTFVPQHSDARVLEQLAYKWSHSRAVIAEVLADQFEQLAATGRPVTVGQVEGAARMLLAENYDQFRGVAL